MILITPEEQISQSAELLHSVHRSLKALRQQAEQLRQQIEDGVDTDLTDGTRQLAKANDLIRQCQKVETQLVEQSNKQAGIAGAGYVLDLDEARSKVGSLLARLRASADPRDVFE